MGIPCDNDKNLAVSRFLVDEITPEYLAMEAYFASFVYVIQADENGPVKIGCASRPTWRLNELQVANWQPLFLRASIPVDNCQMFEEMAHCIAASKNIRGEWFDLKPVEAVEIILTGITMKGRAPLALDDAVRLKFSADVKPYRPKRPDNYEDARRAAMRLRLGID